MSNKGLGRFIDQINSDENLQRALEERFDDLGKVPADELAAFATEHGYAFNVEETTQELSEAALEQVAGGLTVSTTYIDKASPLLTYDVKFDIQSSTFNFLKNR